MNEISFEHQLEEILKKDAAKLINEQKTTFERLTVATGETFIRFGAGRLGQITLAGLRRTYVICGGTERAQRLAWEFVKWNFGTAA